MKRYPNITSILILGILITTSCQMNQDKEVEFWKWFSMNQNELSHFEKNQEKIFDCLTERLHKIDSNLTFEFGPKPDDSIREFTISADGLKESFPSVISLVKKAPKLPKWKINAFRQRIPGDYIQITYDDTLKISYDDIYFQYKHDHKKIGLELNVRKYKNDSGFDNAIFILLDGLIGEYDMETKISWIDRKVLIESEISSLHKLVELRDIVDKLKK